MRKSTAYILLLTAAVSCMPMDREPGDIMPPPEDDFHYLTGKVSCETDDRPIEHIKVTINWNDGMQEDVKYTNSDGYFNAELPKGRMDSIPVSIKLEDTDGDENGGLFETVTDNIIFRMPTEESPTAVLDYHLNHATASESSPQS